MTTDGKAAKGAENKPSNKRRSQALPLAPESISEDAHIGEILRKAVALPPPPLNPRDVLSLQRVIGNDRVCRLLRIRKQSRPRQNTQLEAVQSKTSSSPGDHFFERVAKNPAEPELPTGSRASVEAKAPQSMISRNEEVTPEQLQEWSTGWLQRNLSSGFEDIFGINFQGWQIGQGRSSGRGQLGVNVPLATTRTPLRARFIEEFTAHYRGQRLPRGRTNQPGVLFFSVLAETAITLSITEGAEFARLEATNTSWTTQGWQSQLVQVNLLRHGGPVTVSANLTLGGETLGTLTESTMVTMAGVGADVAEQVLRYRETIERVCTELNMRPDVVMAIISMETRGIPTAGSESRTHHLGLMQAGSFNAAPGESREELQARMDRYLGDIEQQIRDGIGVFQQKRQTLERSPYEFDFNDPLTENDLVIIHMAYGAGEQTMRLALARADHLGREDWYEEDVWVPALVYTGAHHPPFAVNSYTREWDRDRLRRELIEYCGMSEEEVDAQFPADRRGGLTAMRQRLLTQVQARRGALRRSIDVNSVTMQQLEEMDAWVLRSARYKYGNIDPRGNYMRQYMTYRRYFESALSGGWQAPLLRHEALSEERVVGSPSGATAPTAGGTPGAAQ